jgi:hypothetical protein
MEDATHCPPYLYRRSGTLRARTGFPGRQYGIEAVWSTKGRGPWTAAFFLEPNQGKFCYLGAESTADTATVAAFAAPTDFLPPSR